MHNTLKRAVIATNQKAQYDAKVKNLLGHKIILAHILTRTVDEFKGMNPRTADYRSEYGKRGNKRGTDKI